MTEMPVESHPRRVGEAELVPGDVFVVANETDQPFDPRAGIKGYGRYWHCDHDLNVKAQVWTGDYGLIIGLAIDPARRIIYAVSPQMEKIMAFDPEGREVAIKRPPRRRYGNLVVQRDGAIVIGVHSAHGAPPADDGHGDGKLVRFDPVSGAFEFFDIEWDGGRGGQHYVSNLALSGDERIAYYVSEAGKRVCRYDLVERRQLPDFHVFDAESEDGTYGIAVRDSGEVVMATGIGALRFDPDGKIIQRYDIPRMRGWTRARLAPDQRHVYLGNFTQALLHRVDIETGETVASLDIGLPGALTAVAEYAPA